MDSIVQSGGDLCEFFKAMFRRKKWLSQILILFGARVGSAGDPRWDGSWQRREGNRCFISTRWHHRSDRGETLVSPVNPSRSPLSMVMSFSLWQLQHFTDVGFFGWSNHACDGFTGYGFFAVCLYYCCWETHSLHITSESDIYFSESLHWE